MAVPAPHPSLVVSLGVTALILWRVYARVRRMVGRQRFRRGRSWFTVIFFPLLLAMLFAISLAHPLNLVALAAGAALGIALGVYGLHLTRFESTLQGMFYTPSAHLGIALSLLFIGRVGYRLMQLNFIGGDGPTSSSDFARSPLTLAIFGTLAGYYVAYAIGLLRWAHRVDAEGPFAEPSVDPAPMPASPTVVDLPPPQA
jgi:hypothetical protein